MPVVAIGEENGLPVVPAFTSEREVGSWFNEATPYVGMSGDVVLRMLLTTPWSRLVIDPASQRPVEIDRAEAERLLNR